ncbi:MAG: hypothetical protein ABI678_08475 [Kofleriaceae bacterium]
MKLLIASALLLTMGCLTDPPYRPYAGHPQQNGYGPQPGAPPPGGANNYPTYQTSMGPAPAGPQPPPFVEPQGGVTVASSGAQPPPSSAAPPPPGYYQTPGVQPAPGASPVPPPAQTAAPAQAAGRYQCWVVGAGMYAQSSLGMITLDFSGSYATTANAATPGTYRVDGNRVMFTGGPIASYVGVIETNRNGPFLRFRVERPNDPGPQLGIGDHVCYLAR